jgi:hypothetical protein
VEWLRRHADKRHDLQELLLAGVTQLLDVVTACNRRPWLIATWADAYKRSRLVFKAPTPTRDVPRLNLGPETGYPD